MIFLIVITLFAFSCTNPGKNPDSFTIHGQFSNCTGTKVIFEEMDINAIRPLDSLQVDPSGKIRFTKKADQAGFYLLKFPGRKKILLLLDKSEILEITGDCGKPAEPFILKGSPGTLLLEEFFKATERNKKVVDSLKTLIHAHEGSPDLLQVSMEADAVFQRVAESQRALELAFINKNPNSLACLIVLNYSFGPRPILDIDADFSYYKTADSILQLSYPGNKHVVYHHQRVMERKRMEAAKLEKGQPAQGNKK